MGVVFLGKICCVKRVFLTCALMPVLQIANGLPWTIYLDLFVGLEITANAVTLELFSEFYVERIRYTFPLFDLVCTAKCRDASLSCSVHNTSECCHPNCLGGCTGPTAGDCLICRNFHHNNTCLSSCPDGLYEVIASPQHPLVVFARLYSH